jgi:HEPN domain-containing protein
MITATELRQTALRRLEDAEVLFAADRWDSAIYICGYALEIALKAKVCTTPQWVDFPLSSDEFKIIADQLKSVQTHDLETLLRLSGEITTVKSSYLAEWSVVANWNPESRYKPPSASRDEALRMIESAKTLLQVLGVV